MNYEELYKSLQLLEKELKDRFTAAQKLCKTIEKDSECGDLKSLSKNLSSLTELTQAQSSTLSSLRDTVDCFDAQQYFTSGEFTAQLLSLCEEKGIDVKGETPVFEMFPYRVRIDAENQDVYLDKKRIPCVRPQSFVNTVIAGQEKLNKASFNPQAFAGELADVYDLELARSGKTAGCDISLSTLYKLLTPMGRFRRDYDQQSFAFDLARLYSEYIAGMDTTKDGRRFQFGPTRVSRRSIRILDRSGNEQYLATICFFAPDTQD